VALCVSTASALRPLSHLALEEVIGEGEEPFQRQLNTCRKPCGGSVCGEVLCVLRQGFR
jgi:hypothetical protein